MATSAQGTIRGEGRRLGLATGAIIAIATIAAYFPALGAGFIWDDDAHVTRPALRSLHGLWRIWFDVGATQQYYPVLHSAFWLEHRLWGDSAFGYHLLNVLLHASAAFLFVCVLRNLVERLVPRRLFDWLLLAGLLFAVHPVCVESVAWISEQKNTLSAVFYLLAMLSYLDYAELARERTLPGRWSGSSRDACDAARVTDRTSVSGRAAPPIYDKALARRYFVSLLLFVLALLSKSVTASLPAALLVIFWWKRGGLSWKRDVVPLLPFFGVGIVSGLFTAWVERRFIIGADAAAFVLTFSQRCLLAGRVAWFYLGKLVWPANLNFVYPRWHIGGAWPQVLFPLAALAALACLWLLRKRTRAPLAAALFFVGTLFPALGFFNAYPFVFSYVADHFQYLAMLGVIALGAGGWSALGSRRGFQPRFAMGTRLKASSALLIVCALGVLTWRQCRVYRDSETLYRDTLALNPNAFMARNNLAKLLRESGRPQEAIQQYLAVLRERPDAESHYNLGVALASAGLPDDAALEFREALQLRPAYPEAHINLAVALARLGRYPEAIEQDREALSLRPDLSIGRRPAEGEVERNAAEAHDSLGDIFLAQRRPAEAVDEFQAAIAARPDDASAQNGLGAALSAQGRDAEAAACFEQALRIEPSYPEAHVNLAISFAKRNRLPEAIAQFREALHLRPGMPVVHFDLANALAQAGRPSEAAAEYQEALRLKPDFPQARAALDRLSR